MAATSPSVVQLAGVGLRYGKTVALADIQLDLPAQRAGNWQVRRGDAQHMSDAQWVESQFRDLIARCEKITGKKFGDYLEENIFSPLAMKRPVASSRTSRAPI